MLFSILGARKVEKMVEQNLILQSTELFPLVWRW